MATEAWLVTAVTGTKTSASFQCTTLICDLRKYVEQACNGAMPTKDASTEPDKDAEDDPMNNVDDEPPAKTQKTPRWREVGCHAYAVPEGIERCEGQAVGAEDAR